MPRAKSNPAPADAAPTFEEALAGLEAVVEAMEREQLPLEDLVASYEKGSALLERCEAILQAARGRIELITLRSRGAATADEEDRGQAPGLDDPGSRKPDDSDDDDDIRLF